jgi:hypothetical protein
MPYCICGRICGGGKRSGDHGVRQVWQLAAHQGHLTLVERGDAHLRPDGAAHSVHAARSHAVRRRAAETCPSGIRAFHVSANSSTCRNRVKKVLSTTIVVVAAAV